jgi:sec-independent protein translocase protein TatC
MRAACQPGWRSREGVISFVSPWVATWLWADREDVEADQDSKMSFLDHLDELRRRLIACLVAASVASFVCWTFREKIYDFVTIPITQFTGEKLKYLTPAEPFTVYMQISLMAGIFLASPIILWQFWLFISPGLYRREKRFALPFLAATTILFLLGGFFAYKVVLPVTLHFLNTFGDRLESNVTATAYLDFAVTTILSCAVMFEIPIVIFFLTILGLVTAHSLIRNLRYATLLCFVIAAVVTPTQDIPTMLVFALPMLALYVVGILVAWVFRRKPQHN